MVESLYLVPDWFYIFDLFLGLAFALISLIVSNYAYRIYQLTKEWEFNLFGISFILISLSYIIRTAMNSFLTTLLSSPDRVLALSDISYFSTIVIFSYAFLFIAGYMTLAFTTINATSKRVYFLILVPSLLAFALSENNSMAIYLITVVALIPICFHYGRLYFKTKDYKRLNMFIATLFLLISNIVSMFISDYHFITGYILSSLLELIAYSIIGISLYMVVKNGEKKK